MAHMQKPDFVFRRNGRVHLNRQGASVQSTTGSRGVRIGGSNAGYTMFRGSVKSTDYPLHQFPLHFPLPCVTVCHHISTGVLRRRVVLWDFFRGGKGVFNEAKFVLYILNEKYYTPLLLVSLYFVISRFSDPKLIADTRLDYVISITAVVRFGIALCF
jgi:hypothetical protein